MDEKCGCKIPTSADSLEQQIIDPSFPKHEREWWASEEIARLRAEVDLVIAQREAWRVSALTCQRSSAEFAANADRLRAEVEALKAENAALASWQCLFTDGTTGLYHDGCGNAQCARDHLVVHLTAEVEALRADNKHLRGEFEKAWPDAERYRHLKSHAIYQSAAWGYHPASYLIRIWDNEDKPLDKASFDAFVDAARAAQGERG